MEQEIGKITHYFSNINVAVVKLSQLLKVGDKIHIKGATSDFEQTVSSMQINHQEMPEASAGQEIGLKVEDKCRGGDTVFKVTEE